MSVTIVGSDHVDYLVTAALEAGLIRPGTEQDVGSELVRANADAFLWRYGPGTDGIVGLTELFDETQDEAGEEERDDDVTAVREWRDGYRWRPVDQGQLSSALTARAVACWRYQVEGYDALLAEPVWALMQSLAARVGPDDPGLDLPWVWQRPAE